MEELNCQLQRYRIISLKQNVFFSVCFVQSSSNFSWEYALHDKMPAIYIHTIKQSTLNKIPLWRIGIKFEGFPP